VCTMKRNDHCIVPEGRFRLLQGEDMLTLYQFNTKVAKHVFCRCGGANQVAPHPDAVWQSSPRQRACRVCGVQSFYTPRSNPDGRAITVACIDAGTVRSVTTEKHDGVNWEESMKNSDIAARSKE